ncbi:hypothetical protein POM88_013803 [Heracleum sosnowskyi]|uniref:Replication factor A C-terminal domain-containing protein n=1 Tax=Heracleum sosnowskyi TaxID=360622 RepID=A0AAD8IZ77_9APIA|nr:hypothetical protein POM88_013803 [Heracleum sosnowskyi]
MAIVGNNQDDTLKTILTENGVYRISNIKIVPGPKLYRTIDRDLAINFLYKTKIENIPDTCVIPRYKFELQPFDKVNSLVGDIRSLIAVAESLRKRPMQRKKWTSSLTMPDCVHATLPPNNHAFPCSFHRKEAMLITLWEDKATQILKLLTASKDGPVFVVITGLLPNNFSAACSLSSTVATRCYVNIDYAPLNALKDALIWANNVNQQSLYPPITDRIDSSDGDTVQELPITSILETLIPAGTQVVHCICRAKIVAILDENGWYYNCCPTCVRALGDLDGKFYCLACDEETPTLAQRFRIVLQIEDQFGSTTVTLLNKEVEQLVGVPLLKILAKEENHIMGIVRNNQKEIFKSILSENGVYHISNIKLVPGPKLYRTVDRDLQPFENVNILVGDVRSLIDVLGMVSSYGQLEKRSNGAKKVDVVLNNAGSYFNIDYTPLKNLKHEISNASGTPVDTLPPPTIRHFVTADEDDIQELSIKSILAAEIPHGKDLLRFLCKAKIIYILDGNGWYYICCSKCARAVKQLEGKYYCAHCVEESSSYTQR